MPTIAVLAVQGAFIEHEQRLEKLGCHVLELRQHADLSNTFDALVLPGGESTTQAKLLHELGMFEPLRERILDGMPVLGTCAGMILLAERIEGEGDMEGLDPSIAEERVQVDGFKTMPITVCKNAYGRQLGSFFAHGLFTAPDSEPDSDDRSQIPLTFIRAPKIVGMQPSVSVLAQLGDAPVAVRYENQIACAFHPELDEDDSIYQAFLSLI